jgi:hypothetical protein
MRYGHRDASLQLLERDLDATAVQFGRSGRTWESYHPQIGD